MADQQCVPPGCPDPSTMKKDPTNLLEAGNSLFESFGYKFPCTGVVATGDTLKHTKFFDEAQCFGTYEPLSEDVRLFDINNPYHEIINTGDQDYIFSYGMQMRYYKIKPADQQTTYDPLYGEAPSREYENGTMVRAGKVAELAETNPIVVWGLYSHEELAQNLTGFGIDSTKVSTLYFNITYIRRVLGRDPMVGDVVIPWDIPEAIYEITRVVATSKTLYVPRRWKLYTQLLQVSK